MGTNLGLKLLQEANAQLEERAADDQLTQELASAFGGIPKCYTDLKATGKSIKQWCL